jgi:hypothetical protein
MRDLYESHVAGPEQLDQNMTGRDVADALARWHFSNGPLLIQLDDCHVRNYLLDAVKLRIGIK